MKYIIDNDTENEITLEVLLSENEFEDSEITEIKNMQIGDCVYFALGTELKRIA